MEQEHFEEGMPKLGFGLMRLPKRNLVMEDVEQISQMVDLFLAAGMKYFDTAYLYDVGNSEKAIRKALVERYPRDQYTLATKLCAFMMCHNEETAKKQFYTSLERTGAGYFDFYLLHALQKRNLRKYDDYHIWDFVQEQKEKGLIRHWGFSFHDTPEVLEQILTDHPEAEFVQLQINYEDWDSKSVCSRANYEVARRHGKPVVVMEPVKGGRLAKLPAKADQLLKETAPNASAASWAIRFAASLDGVMTVLSGMSNLAQMEDNLSYMKQFQPLTAQERAVLQQVRTIIGASATIPCTACHYCTAGCPRHIDIPGVFAAMNQTLAGGETAAARGAYEKILAAGSGRASECIRCGQCERACPQHIHIIDRLQECAASLEENKQ